MVSYCYNVCVGSIIFAHSVCVCVCVFCVSYYVSCDIGTLLAKMIVCVWHLFVLVCRRVCVIMFVSSPVYVLFFVCIVCDVCLVLVKCQAVGQKQKGPKRRRLTEGKLTKSQEEALKKHLGDMDGYVANLDKLKEEASTNADFLPAYVPPRIGMLQASVHENIASIKMLLEAGEGDYKGLDTDSKKLVKGITKEVKTLQSQCKMAKSEKKKASS